MPFSFFMAFIKEARFLDTLVSIFSIVGAIIIIGIIILVHELGHYSIGRLCKIKIVEFAVGFGPKIKSWVKNDIKYSIRWIFLGGFTKFYGEDDELDDKDAFNRQPAGRRALTIAAGPVFNILFALLLTIIILSSFGEYSYTIGEVWEGSPAEQAGLQEGDVVISMDGVELEFYMEMEAARRNSNNQYTMLTVQRDGQELSFKVPKAYYDKIPEGNRNGRTDEQMVVNNYMAGISFGSQHKTYGFFEAIGKSFKWIVVLFRETIIGLVTFFGGIFGLADRSAVESAAGFFGMVDMIALAFRTSLENVLRLGVAISASLAVFNLIPFPALDGGRLVFIGIEKATGKPVPRNVEGFIHLIGFVILIGFMVLISYKDIVRMISG